MSRDLPLLCSRRVRLFTTLAFFSVFLNVGLANEAANWAVVTFAGKASVAGADDGMAGNARFNGPRGIVIDAAGQIFVANALDHTVRKISPSGAVTTFAGRPGTAGSADGAGANALFNSPAGLAIDSDGVVYVADTLNHTIRKIDSDGMVSTLAGSAGLPGSDDGLGDAARFEKPVGIAVDGNGNIYIADTGNSVVRKITSSGNVSTFAGSAGETGCDDGVGGLARFNQPHGLGFDTFGNLYVADTFNHTIRKITATGEVTTVAGAAGQSGTADGLSISARFSGPCSLAIGPAGNVYVSEVANHEIRAISSSGLVSTVAGSSGNDGCADGVGSASLFDAPCSVAVGPACHLFVGDTANNTIRKLTRVQRAIPPPVEACGKIINLSTRCYVGLGGNIMIAGFIITGSEPKQVLIRASGPALAPFGVTDALEDPVLTVYSGNTQIAQDDDWASDHDRIEQTAIRVNAFTWTRGSKDAALLVTLPPGGYTAHIAGKNGGTGTALIETYEADEVATTAKLVSISTRAEVRTSGAILIAGFIVGGTTPKRVLIRASGPALADFLPNGTLRDPILTVKSTYGQIAENDDWDCGDQTGIENALSQIGAFAWKRGSKDAALLLTLSPGAYTAAVCGKAATTGISLVEVYEVP